MELEYKRVYNQTLKEIRFNISCKYHKGTDKSGNAYPLHPLDEVRDNTNAWAKRILLGPDELSWKVYSPNVACANMYVNFEESEYVKGNLHYDNANKSHMMTMHHSSKTVEPRKVIEHNRLHEWCMVILKAMYQTVNVW